MRCVKERKGSRGLGIFDVPLPHTREDGWDGGRDGDGRHSPNVGGDKLGQDGSVSSGVDSDIAGDDMLAS